MENEEKDVDLNNDEVVDTEEDNSEVDTTTEEETKVEKPKESLEDRRARLKRQLEQTEKKLGIDVKKPEKKPSETSNDKLSDKDLIAIMNNKVHEDDVEEVVEIARFKKISVSEALKLPLTKTILAEKSEFRKSAEVSNTGSGRQSTKKVSPETLVNNLSKGIVPEKGSQEAEELFWARRGGRR